MITAVQASLIIDKTKVEVKNDHLGGLITTHRMHGCVIFTPSGCRTS